MSNLNPDTENKKLVAKLLLVVVGMFGFVFALVPLYYVICDLTGLNGNTSNLSENAVRTSAEVIDDRLITVQFMVQKNADMSWDFSPVLSQVKVHPGEIKVINYQARNNSNNEMVAQAIPSISPNAAAQYMHKLECFCFEQQILGAGEEALLSLRFFIDTEIPEGINKLTLYYALFDITEYDKSVALN